MKALKSFLPILVLLLLTSCHKRKQLKDIIKNIEEVSINKITYKVWSEYSASDKQRTIHVSLTIPSTDTINYIKINSKDTLLVSGMPFKFDGYIYSAIIPADTTNIKLYLKLKDTVCFQAQYQLPCFKTFELYTDYGEGLRRNLYVKYSPASDKDETIKLEIPNGRYSVYDAYGSEMKTDNKGSFLKSDSTDRIELPMEVLQREGARYPSQLTLTRIKKGETVAGNLILEYYFMLSKGNNNIREL